MSQEFKEAMRAHAIYQYPHCLFKGKHSGRKVVVIYCFWMFLNICYLTIYQKLLQLKATCMEKLVVMPNGQYIQFANILCNN